MKDWRRERWRRLYLREAAQQRATWALMARGIRDYAVRLAEDDGTLVDDAGDNAFDVLIRVLAPQPDEEASTRAACVVLLADGYLEQEDGRIWIVNLPAAQGDDEVQTEAGAIPTPRGAPKSNAERQREHRERKRREREALRDSVTGAPEPSRDSAKNSNENRNAAAVTSNVTTSRVLSQDLPSGSVETSQKNQKNQPEEPESQHSDARDAKRDGGRDSERYARDVTRSVTDPKSRAEALTMGEGAAAAYLLAHPYADAYLEPQLWPTVIAVSQALSEAAGRPERKLGQYQQDKGVKAVIGLLAAGNLPSVLVRVAKALPTLDFWQRSPHQLGLSSFTPDVLERAQAELDRSRAPGGPMPSAVARDLLAAHGFEPKAAP
jgi:hypothetical protein